MAQQLYKTAAQVGDNIAFMHMEANGLLPKEKVLDKVRYRVWSALYNFDCRTSDGSTPASRFFRREFPDLFEAVLAQIDALPWPRQHRTAVVLSD
jgi:hypothetical protein